MKWKFETVSIYKTEGECRTNSVANCSLVDQRRYNSRRRKNKASNRRGRGSEREGEKEVEERS